MASECVLPALRDMNHQGFLEMICGRESAIIFIACSSLNIPFCLLQLLLLACVRNFPIEIFPGHKKIIHLTGKEH